MKVDLFEVLRKERAAGKLVTIRDWLARNPPPASAFVQTVAGIAGRVRAGDPFKHAVREFLDEFSLRPTKLRGAALSERPEPAGDARYDAYLAALAEHLAVSERLPCPSWTQEQGRFLDHFWFPSTVPGFRAIAIAQSPAAFRRRGIFIGTSSLTRF